MEIPDTKTILESLPKDTRDNIQRFLNLQAEEWRIGVGVPPESFDSMHTNCYGEVWWAKFVSVGGKPQVLVWGEDVRDDEEMTRSGLALSRTYKPRTMPWSMGKDEQAWADSLFMTLREWCRGAPPPFDVTVIEIDK